MSIKGVVKNFSNFYLKCNKCGSNDVVISCVMFGDNDDTIDAWEDEIEDVMLNCRKCGLKEVQECNWVEV